VGSDNFTGIGSHGRHQDTGVHGQDAKRPGLIGTVIPGEDQPQVEPCGSEPSRGATCDVGGDHGPRLPFPGWVGDPRQRSRRVPVHDRVRGGNQSGERTSRLAGDSHELGGGVMHGRYTARVNAEGSTALKWPLGM